MIRGVNRYAVEVSRTENPYFERAICFVRPQFASCDRLALRRAAQQMVEGLCDGVEVTSDEEDVKETTVPFARLPLLARLLLPALIGAVTTLIICLLVIYT